MKFDFVSERMSQVTDSITLARKDQRSQRFMLLSEKEGGLQGLAERGIQAGILNNFTQTVCNKVTDSVDIASTRGQSVNMMADFGPYIPEVWPIIVAWYPDFPLKDLISVQDMKQDLAYLLFSKLVTGTNKSPTVVGQVVETAQGPREIDGSYPGGEIMGENIVSSQIDFDATTKMLIAALAYEALDITGDALEKFKFIVSGGSAFDGVYTPLTASLGKVILQKDGDATDSGSYVDIVSGGLYIYAAAATEKGANTEIVANYVWNIDYAVDENIQKVKEQVDKVEMRAKPRVLSMQWTIFAEALKRSQFGTDIREENTRRVLDLLYQYQVRYILDTMWTYAAGTPATITIPALGAYNIDVLAMNVAQQLRTLANVIEITTGRMEGNRLVVGQRLKAFFQSLPSTWWTPSASAENDAFSSPREIGTFAGFKVYYDPQRKANEGFMTYRGKQWYDAAFYMGVFLPLVPTDAIAINVTARQAFAEMVAYRFHKPTAVIPFKVVDGPSALPGATEGAPLYNKPVA